MVLRRIIYTSKASEPLSKRGLLDMHHESRVFNSIDNISGVLMQREGTFIQVIEGDSENVDDLFTRIQNDSRHKEIKLIQDSSAASRLFSNWAMGCVDFDEPELSLIPGIRTDLSDPQVIEDIVIHLPEIATYLLENLD